MGLRNLVIRRETIRLPDGQSFDVRGITLYDLMMAVGDYGPQMSLLFGKLTNGGSAGGFKPDDIKVIIVSLAREFPEVLVACIALAADDYSPEGMAKAKEIPISTQIEAVQAIFSLSFQSEGELGKVLESLVRMMVAASGALKKAISPDGIGASDGN